ncbi:MAG: SHOCT domain-containing protein [Nitrospirae bacterium]|nr:SHOCT domain-containing protein [Nitrospirota bacterium]
MTAGGKDKRALSTPFLMITILAVAISFGATPASRVACGMCEEADRFVRLQISANDRPEESTQPFSHPFRWSAEQWKPILRSIYVQKIDQGLFFFSGRNGPKLQAFTPTEVDYLSETLTRAFAQAQPSEMVVFGLTSQKTREMTEITTGAWYVKDAQLHLILGNYREAVTMSSVRELLWQDPLHMIAGALYEFVPGPHQSLTGEGGIGTFLIPEAPQLALTYQQLLSDASRIDGGQEKGSSSSAHPDSSLEGKLKRLKQIHDEGLITDDEFAAKKKMLLDGF